jgi:hypothetical protein
VPLDSGTPQFRPQQPSGLCSLGLRAHLMTGVLRHLVGDHFSRPENVEEPELRGLVWRAGGTGNILIESIARWKPSELGRRPAVIIKRGDWQAERLFPDDQYGTTPQGAPIFMNLMHGSHTLFCISNAGEEAEILATEVFGLIAGFAHLIRKTLQLTRFVPVGIGPEFEIEEAKENYAVPFTVTYANQHSWTIHEHAPRLRGVDFEGLDLAP